MPDVPNEVARDLAMAPTFVRSNKVHRSTCRYAKGGDPWLWAEGRPMAEVFRRSWNEPCRICIPEAVLVGGRWFVPEPDDETVHGAWGDGERPA